MTTNSQNTSSISQVSFLNLFGIVISIILCVLFIILGGHALKYIKNFACKIKIIVNRAEDKNVQLKDFNWQGKEGKQRSEAYDQLETIYKEEIKKSRSLQYCTILKNLLAKYDHLLYYPFRDRMMEQYDLLKPKTTFYNLLIITSCCISWMTTIFLSAILSSAYSNVTLIPIGIFAGLTVAISIISSILNIISTNRLFRIYLINVKAAFKVDYGHQFLNLDQGLKDYEPDDTDEEEELFRHEDKLRHLQMEDLDKDEYPVVQQEEQQNEGSVKELLQSEMMSHRTLLNGEDSQIQSSRKLLQDDNDRSDQLLLKSQLVQNQDSLNQDIQQQSNNLEQEVQGEQTSSVIKQKVKGKAIKDIFEIEMGIQGAENANEDDKYIFVEDKHALGDMDLLENEANKGENKSNVMTFGILFAIIAIASAVCCYLNYTFSSALAQYVFIMFIVSFFGDLIVSRPIILMIIAIFKFCKAKKNGYKKIQYKSPKEVKDALGKAIKGMFENRKKYKEEQMKRPKGSMDSSHLLLGKSNSQKGDLSGDQAMLNYDHLTQNADKNDTVVNKFGSLGEDHEDQYAQEIIHKHDDDGPDGNRLALNFINRMNPTDFARPQMEDDQKNNFEKTQVHSYNTAVPLLASLKNAIMEKEKEMFSSLMEKKQINNELVDYNLLLLRKIYDAYEDRADKVLKNFRSDRHGVLRKRYMVPVLNPNYDYEKLLREMKEAGKGGKETVDEDLVKLDGMTVCEDQDQQLMDAINQEASDTLQQYVERQRIDRFGNLIDEEKMKNGITKAECAPSFGKVELECEDNIVEDDEDARKWKLLKELREKWVNGTITPEELAMLEQLEFDRLKELERLIALMLKDGYDALKDEDKLICIDYQIERCNILLDKEARKDPKDEVRIDKLEDELNKLELEKLRLRSLLFGLTEEELDKLYQLEQERLMRLMKRIGELEQIGWDNLENKEKFELINSKKECLHIELARIHRKKPPLSEEDVLRIKEIEEELRALELQELLLKQQLGLLSEDELKRLEELIRLKDLAELEGLLKKLRDGTISEEELRRLRELEGKLGLEPEKNPFEEQIEKNEKFEDIMEEEVPEQQQELDDQIEEDDEDILHSRITDQDNFSELPPVQVMNNFNQSPDKLDEIDERAEQEEKERLEQEERERLEQEEQERLEQEERVRLERLALDETQRLELERLDQEERERLEREQEEERIRQEQEEFSKLQQQLEEQEARDRLNDQLNEQNLEDGFNREDLEAEAPLGADGEESIYSHKTTTILDEEKVSFMHIDHLPNLDKDSDESFAEQDMVPYYKDDLTRYSENRGINRVKVRQAPNYYSENDLPEVKEGEQSDVDSVGGRSGDGRRRRSYGRGALSHNQFENTSHEDLIEGRVKVDAWNLNYRGKKKKQKKKKVTANQKKKMLDLQNIYGVDARTLANLGKGRLPRKQLATGKIKAAEFNGTTSRLMMSQDNSMRTTQNTFMMQQSSPTGGKFRQSDNQSNLFSFNGFGTRQNWAVDGLKSNQKDQNGAMRDSRFAMNSQFAPQSTNKKQHPQTVGKKLTATQQDFKNSAMMSGGNRNIPAFEEESKSGYSGSQSRGNSINRRGFGLNTIGSNGSTGSQAKNLKSGMNKGGFGTRKSNNDKSRSTSNGPLAVGGKKSIQSKNRRQISDGMDSHTESDEAVDDKGALFQRRNDPSDYNKKSGYIHRSSVNEDLDHSESEEGNNQDIPNFEGNDLMFKKRGAVNNNEKDSFAKSNKQGQSMISNGTQNTFGLHPKKKGGARASGDELNIEDLEAQSVRGKRRSNKGSTKNITSNKKYQNNGYMRPGTNERQDSEEENDGGQVSFQKRNDRGEYPNATDLDNSGLVKSRSNNNLNSSNQKPPLSNRKLRQDNSNSQNRQQQQLDDSRMRQQQRDHGKNSSASRARNTKNQIKAGPLYSNEKNAAKGRKMRAAQSNGFTHSDAASDNEMYSSMHKRSVVDQSSQNAYNKMLASGRHSDPTLLHPTQKKQGQNQAHRKNRSIDIHNSRSDEEDDYLVGPESNMSSIKKRPLGGSKRASQNDEQEDEYILLQRERQIREEIESEQANQSNILAKKRKIRKAGHSQNPKDAQTRRYKDLQNERLKKRQQEAEGALFANEDDLEAGRAQIKKKKKVKKETVKKEINYWLDYDSPYAEYLVARFREWSPNPQNLIRGPSANHQRSQMPTQNKFNEVMNAYSKNERGSSKGNSRSRDRIHQHGSDSALNLSSQKFNNSNSKIKPFQLAKQNVPNSQNLFVADYEEP